MDKKKKKLKLFFKILIGLCFIWVLITVILDIKLYNYAKNYESRYKKALKNSNPDVFMASYKEKFDSKTLLELLKKDEVLEISKYEKLEEVYSYELESANNGKIQFEKSSNFSELKPIYNMLLDDRCIGLVYLKNGTESDEFGILPWVVKAVYFSPYKKATKTYAFVIRAKDDLFVNGILANEDREIIDTLDDKLIDGIKAYDNCNGDIVRISVKGLANEPDITVKTNSGREVADDYLASINPSYEEELVKIAKSHILDYAKYVNHLISYDVYVNSLYKDCSFKNMVEVNKKNIEWNDDAKSVALENDKVFNVISWSDNVFTCDIEGTLSKTFAYRTLKEDISYHCLFYFDGNKWYLVDLTN